MSTDGSESRPDMEKIGASSWRRRGNIVNLMEIAIGDHIALSENAVALVTDNPRDGSWIIAKYVECPAEPEKVGEEEPIFAEDVQGTVDKV